MKVSVYGSCVSRDAIALAAPQVDVVSYVARQSLISAMSEPSAPVALPRSSSFQRRLVESDFASGAIGTTLAPHPNRILLDLVDERLGVLDFGDGRYVTNSQELRESGAVEQLPKHSRIEFGSDRHFDLWADAATRAVALIRSAGALQSVLLVEATFASEDQCGRPAPKWMGKSADVWNEVYARYYDHVRSLGIRTHRVADGARCDSGHRWGPAAYHYVADVYAEIVSSMLGQGQN